jgi:predicted DNA-binding transcriptional regulator AlpA
MDSNSQIVPIFIRESQVLERYLPASRSTLWRQVKAGIFPAPVKLSGGVTAWLKADLDQWAAEVAGGQDGR